MTGSEQNEETRGQHGLAMIECFMSHYGLQEKYATNRETRVILEHDMMFTEPLAKFRFRNSLCGIQICGTEPGQAHGWLFDKQVMQIDEIHCPWSIIHAYRSFML